MIHGDGWQMLMVTEEQDHEYYILGAKFRLRTIPEPSEGGGVEGFQFFPSLLFAYRIGIPTVHFV